MKPWAGPVSADESLAACVGAVLELRLEQLPSLPAGSDPAVLGVVSRRLGSLGLGLARVADPASFSWPGPWIARIEPPAAGGAGEPRFVVMFGVPSGVVWDPATGGDGRGDPATGGDGRAGPAGSGGPSASAGAVVAEELDHEWIVDGYLLAAADIALARPPVPEAPTETGRVEQIWVAPAAGEPAQALGSARALPGRGLEGDRHVAGTGTFPSGLPGSGLTLIEAEVCESFDPPLGPDDHRRNVLTRGMPLNDLVGHEFTIGTVRCRGMRLCEPCTVVQRYAGRPVLRPLVHRGGLRADILSEGEIRVGDEVRAAVS